MWYSKPGTKAFLVFGLVVLAGSGVARTYRRNADWRDRATLLRYNSSKHTLYIYFLSLSIFYRFFGVSILNGQRLGSCDMMMSKSNHAAVNFTIIRFVPMLYELTLSLQILLLVSIPLYCSIIVLVFYRINYRIPNSGSNQLFYCKQGVSLIQQPYESTQVCN